MNNITHLYNKILNYNLQDCKTLSYFKNFISYYYKKKYNEEKSFLKRVDSSIFNTTSLLKIDKNEYKKYLDFDISNKAKKIILLNGYIWFLDNITSDIIIKSFNNNSVFKNTIINQDFYNDIYNNLNLYYILNCIIQPNYLQINIPDNLSKKEPIYILNFFYNKKKNTSAYTKIAFIFEKDSKTDIININFGNAKNMFINSNLFLYLENKAHVNFFLLNNFKSLSLNVCSLFSKQNDYSKLDFNEIASKNHYYKGIYNFFLSGKKSYLEGKISKRLTNNSTNSIIYNVFHNNILSKSSLKACTITSNKAKSFLKSCIFVNSYNFGIKADLICDGLLLSDLSSVKILPELSICNNNVKCFHGATVGFIDEKIIHYIMSRGLSKKESVNILTNIFLLKCLNKKNIFFNILNNIIIKNYFIK